MCGLPYDIQVPPMIMAPMVHEGGLLSLPDELLAEVAFVDSDGDGKRYTNWINAVMTCKRLRDLQFFSRVGVDGHKGLKWHLKRSQHAKTIILNIQDWPCDAAQLEKLSDELMEVSCNLQQLEELELWPIEERSEAFPLHLPKWISGMLSGASALRHVELDVELLQCLPLSRRKALKSLHLNACITQARAVPEAVQAVLECQQLEELTIRCVCSDSFCGLEIPVLDLRHLVGLSHCEFDTMPAPGSLLLSRGEVDLRLSHDQLAAWSKLPDQFRDHVLCMKINAYSTEVLQAWPQGIQAFCALQFLQINTLDVWPCAGGDTLDLTHFAHIPHVSLCSFHRLSIRISTGNWKILDLESSRTFGVAFDDVEAFLKSISAFHSMFNNKERPEDLINKLNKAGADTGVVLYEHECYPALPSQLVLSNIKPDPASQAFFGEMFLRARNSCKQPQL